MSDAPATLATVIDALDAADPTTPVITDDGCILALPMPGAPVGDARPELTVAPMPAQPGETQTVAEVRSLLHKWTSTGDDRSQPGLDSTFVLAPLGAPARVVVGTTTTGDRLVLNTRPL